MPKEKLSLSEKIDVGIMLFASFFFLFCEALVSFSIPNIMAFILLVGMSLVFYAFLTRDDFKDKLSEKFISTYRKVYMIAVGVTYIIWLCNAFLITGHVLVFIIGLVFPGGFVAKRVLWKEKKTDESCNDKGEQNA